MSIKSAAGDDSRRIENVQLQLSQSGNNLSKIGQFAGGKFEDRSGSLLRHTYNYLLTNLI